MNTSHESLKLWLSDVLTADGAYGATVDRPASFDPDRDPRHASRPKQTQRLSSVVASGRLTVPACGGSHAATDTRLTVKLKPPVELLRTVLKSDRQFHNEMHAYQNVVPFLFEHLPDGARGPALPVFVYGRNECGARWSEDVIVLEDPRNHGYVPARTPEHVAGAGSAHMDYGHLAVAIAALGRFHGMSFTAKQKNPVAFRKLVGNLREIQWDEDGWLVKGNGLKSMSMRGARPLMDQDKYRDGKLKGFLTMIREADRNLKLAMTPKEPFAVICHGDYCKPNILFEYDDAGHPRDAMITEFTAVR
eukprot:XP_016659168.1 PREDICTED: uncharacterized protein LOC103309165 [Acyrthosiphon pisum]